MSDYKYSWIPDVPDIRDWIAKEVFKLAAEHPWKLWKWLDVFNWFKPTVAEVDLRPKMPPVYNQGSLGSCVDNAWAAALSFLENKEGNSFESFSRLFLYWNARTEKSYDTGSTIRDSIKGVANYGVCLETLWPYDINKYPEKPPDAAWAEALHRKDGLQYARLITLDDMKGCLQEGYPFVFGMSVYKPFETLWTLDCTLPMPKSTDQYMGGHSMCVVGMSEQRQAFLVRNSWGTFWGDAGHCWIPYDYLASPFLADDFWTVRKVAK